MVGFMAAERRAQETYFCREFEASQYGYHNSKHRLLPERKALNLAPGIRDQAIAYFAKHRIIWHRHANHALSSQVCCLNFLMPLATRPRLLARIIETALGLSSVTMLKVECGPDGQPWFVGFEWIGDPDQDYLNESRSGRRTRGANATSADAVVKFEHGGRVETLLIEWKYTESYGAPIRPAGNPTRRDRYAGLAFAPDGPIRAGTDLQLCQFFWEPFYQLLRQQMLAWQMQVQAEREGRDERVRVLHISPAGNLALHRVTAPALRRHGQDAFEVFRGLLVRPDDFLSRSTEAVFGGALSEADEETRSWSGYLFDRYTFLASRDDGDVPPR